MFVKQKMVSKYSWALNLQISTFFHRIQGQVITKVSSNMPISFT